MVNLFPMEFRVEALEAKLDALSIRVGRLEDSFDALSIRFNALEKAHNRLAHYVGHATSANTIDRDMGAKL